MEIGGEQFCALLPLFSPSVPQPPAKKIELVLGWLEGISGQGVFFGLLCLFFVFVLQKLKEGKKEGRSLMEGRKEGRKEPEGRKEGRKQGSKEARKEVRK